MEFQAELHKSGMQARKLSFHAKSVEEAQKKAIDKTGYKPDNYEPYSWAQLPDDIVRECELGIAMYWTANSINHMLSIFRIR